METLGTGLEPLRIALLQVGEFLPRLLVGLLILLVGWLGAKAVRLGLEKLLRAFNFNVLFQRSGLDDFLRQGGSQADTVRLFGFIAFWLVLLLAALVAATTMGLPRLSTLLQQIVWFLPRLLLGLLILAGGSYFARFVGGTVASYGRSARVPEADVLGRLARYAVMVFVILITLDQTGIGGDLIRQSFLIILAGVVFALALAFGLGGKHWAADRLESWWPRSPKTGQPAAPLPPPGDGRG